MARIATTTTWTENASAVAGASIQNMGPGPLLVAVVAAADPGPAAANTDVGFVLQAGDFLPLSGLASSDIHTRTFSGTGSLEIVQPA